MSQVLQPAAIRSVSMLSAHLVTAVTAVIVVVCDRQTDREEQMAGEEKA